LKLRDFALFTDENVAPEVVQFLRDGGFDVSDVAENGWQGDSDDIQMRRAFAEGRVILTHDADIGQLAWNRSEPVVGMIHLRPGDLAPAEQIRVLQGFLMLDPDLTAPFLAIAKRAEGGRGIYRIRGLSP